LSAVFPEEKWTYEKFTRRDKRSRQRWLVIKLREIFGKAEKIYEDYWHETLSRKSGSAVQLDVYIPEIRLAFEYQGEHHYSELRVAGFGNLESQRIRDWEKLELCSEHGIKLIIIPYWWDNRIESLLATILQAHTFGSDMQVNLNNSSSTNDKTDNCLA